MKGCSQQDKDKVTPEYWLKKFMEKGIHCVAITDHNSGGWIDRLQQMLDELGSSQNKPDWYRPLYLFPGVEISANGGVHILAIFGLDKNKSDIDQLLGAVDYQEINAIMRKNVMRLSVKLRDGAVSPFLHMSKKKRGCSKN